MTFELLHNAKVEVKQIINSNKTSQAEITINDKYQHRFSPKSRVSKHLDIMTPKDLSDRLTGGSFFFIQGELIDFRDHSYNGFIHDEETISVFMEILGFQQRKNLPFHHSRKRDNHDQSDIILRKVWSNTEIVVPGYQQGGQFTSQLSFLWNPYVKTINSSFDLVREICTNGMVGLTSFLNTKVPVMNREVEHLDIASRQIQNKVTSVVIERIKAMGVERASIGDCLLLEQHAYDRLYSPGEKAGGERDRLLQLMTAVAPKQHLGHVYRDNIFTDKNMAKQLPAHLSNFDVFNIATELRSHTGQCAKSSDVALDRFSNGIIFDRQDNFGASAARFTAGPTSSFADAERAFYSNMS